MATHGCIRCSRCGGACPLCGSCGCTPEQLAENRSYEVLIAKPVMPSWYVAICAQEDKKVFEAVEALEEDEAQRPETD